MSVTTAIATIRHTATTATAGQTTIDIVGGITIVTAGRTTTAMAATWQAATAISAGRLATSSNAPANAHAAEQWPGR